MSIIARVRARNAVALMQALLLVDFAVWHAQRFSAPTAVLLSGVAAAPWMVLAPSLWRGERRGHAWATLVTAPYLGYGIMEVLANPGARPFAAGLVLASVGLFVALTAYLRVSRPTGPALT